MHQIQYKIPRHAWHVLKSLTISIWILEQMYRGGNKAMIIRNISTSSHKTTNLHWEPKLLRKKRWFSRMDSQLSGWALRYFYSLSSTENIRFLQTECDDGVGEGVKMTRYSKVLVDDSLEFSPFLFKSGSRLHLNFCLFVFNKSNDVFKSGRQLLYESPSPHFWLSFCYFSHPDDTASFTTC